MQCHGAVAAECCLQHLHVSARRGVSLIIPYIFIAGRLGDLVGLGRIDGEMQRHGAVATIDGLELLHV